MKVNDPNLSSVASAEAAQTQTAQTQAANQAAKTQAAAAAAGASRTPEAAGNTTGDDVHLSELVRSLRTLAADSPERQAYVDQIAKTYANGSYQLDPNATAGKIIDDALGHK